MTRHKSETALAWVSIAATALHFVLETWFHMMWGQPLQALLVDYIGNALMITAAVASLRIRPRSMAGPIAAAWTFYLGFSWRSFFGRLEERQQGMSASNGEADFVLPLISFGLLVIAVCMTWSLYLAWRQSLEG